MAYQKISQYEHYQGTLKTNAHSENYYMVYDDVNYQLRIKKIAQYSFVMESRQTQNDYIFCETHLSAKILVKYINKQIARENSILLFFNYISFS